MVHRDNAGRFVRFAIKDDFLDNVGPEQAWFIGLMAADGAIHKTNGVVSISQSGPYGLSLIRHLSDILQFDGNITCTQTVGKDSHRISFTSNRIKDSLALFNVVPQKSLTYTFPENLSGVLTADFIRGYIEGDGCVGVYDNGSGVKYLKISFVGTRQFIERCQQKVPVKGGMSSNKAKNCIELSWNGKNAVKMGDWLYANPSLYSGRKLAAYEYGKRLNTRWSYYESQKERAIQMLSHGTKPMVVAKELALPFQTIYKWRKQCSK